MEQSKEKDFSKLTKKRVNEIITEQYKSDARLRNKNISIKVSNLSTWVDGTQYFYCELEANSTKYGELKAKLFILDGFVKVANEDGTESMVKRTECSFIDPNRLIDKKLITKRIARLIAEKINVELGRSEKSVEITQLAKER